MTLHWQSRDYVIQDRQSGRSEVGRICYRQLLARQLGVKRHLSLPARPHFHTVHNHDDHGDDDDDSTNDVDDVDEVSHSRQGGWDGAKSAVLAAPTDAPLYHLGLSTLTSDERPETHKEVLLSYYMHHSTICTTLLAGPLYSYI